MKDYKVDKASLSETFCREVYQVVCEIPLAKVSTYGSIAALLGMPHCSRLGRTKTNPIGRGRFFQTKWVCRPEKAPLELLRF